MNFDLIRPCANCPFRNDKPGYLRRERVEELEEGMERGTFACHKTVDYDRWDEESGEDGEPADYTHDGTEQHCAGALILMEKEGRPSQLMRIGERIGFYNPEKLDMNSPVYASWAEMADAMQE